jgi:serine phosphatase RsbU (regulator of sigma subunit)
MNGRDEMFGFERLETIVKEGGADLSAKQVAAAIVESVSEFAGPTKQHDDMTVVVVRVL